MDSSDRRSYLDVISHRIIGCAHRVSNSLGSGFLEKVYENALALELREEGLEVQQQHQIKVVYRQVAVGTFSGDLLVQNCILVELKAAKALNGLHVAQCMNYLKATGLCVCLLMNFGTNRIIIRRVVLGF